MKEEDIDKVKEQEDKHGVEKNKKEEWLSKKRNI